MKDRGAFISDDKSYRWTLYRVLDVDEDFDRGDCLFIMNNPSTADAYIDDPTIKRVMNFAEELNFGIVWVLNINPFRATDPSKAKVPPEEILEINDQWLKKMAKRCDYVICAWGGKGNPKLIARTIAIVNPIRDLYALDLTKAGQPKHPLYLRKDLTPKLWRARSYGGPKPAVVR